MQYMLFIDRYKLESILSSRGLSINKLAIAAGVSRQSIYNMYEETPVFNTTFEKIRQYLNVDFRAISSDSTLAQEILKKSPDKIKIASYILTEFARDNNADLLLFNTSGTGKYGTNHDWNFAFYFRKDFNQNKFSVLRQQLLEKASPFRVEIFNLGAAPLWLRLLIKNNYIRLLGNTPEDVLFYKGI